MIEEKIKTLREKRKQINEEIKQLIVRERGEGDYDGEAEFPLVYSLEVRVLPRRHRKLKTFPHELPHTVLALRWPQGKKAVDVVTSLPLFLYLGNKKKPDAGVYRMEIRLTPTGKLLEEFRL